MKKIDNSKKVILIDIVLMIILFFIDQFTKVLTREFLMNKPAKPIINGVLELHFLSNKGAIWGIMQGQRIFFILIAVGVFIAMSILIALIPNEKKYIPLNITFVLILAGALGNTYDRIAYEYVTDFIYFKLINFPIFNVADIYITVATFVLFFLILFYYKDEDLEFLNLLKKKNK